MKHRAGDRVEVVVTYLEMTARPGYPRPHLPTGPVSALIGAERPPAWYFLDLYDAVGRDYDWTDQRERPEAEVEAFLHDPDVTLYTFVRDVIAEDFRGTVSAKKRAALAQLLEHPYLHWFMPILGAIVIASPLPDELGIAMLGVSRTRLAYVIPVSLVMNFLGIMLIGFAARAL